LTFHALFFIKNEADVIPVYLCALSSQRMKTGGGVLMAGWLHKQGLFRIDSFSEGFMF
jgi:hypothetical protein